MSNYYCPRCGDTIIDNGGTVGVHWCTPKEILDAITNKIG